MRNTVLFCTALLNPLSAKCLQIHLEMEWVDLLTGTIAKNPYGQAWGESSASSYLADPTSPIPSYCAVIILFESVPLHQMSWLAL